MTRPTAVRTVAIATVVTCALVFGISKAFATEAGACGQVVEWRNGSQIGHNDGGQVTGFELESSTYNQANAHSNYRTERGYDHWIGDYQAHFYYGAACGGGGA